MNVHRASDSDRLSRPEASCVVDDTLAVAQEKETASLASPGLHTFTYALGARSEGTESAPDRSGPLTLRLSVLLGLCFPISVKLTFTKSPHI